jgi:hypothetical protein
MTSLNLFQKKDLNLFQTKDLNLFQKKDSPTHKDIAKRSRNSEGNDDGKQELVNYNFKKKSENFTDF